jgi:hypothetical protein
VLDFTVDMPAILLVSPEPAAGLATIAAGLRRLAGSDVEIMDAPAGDVAAALAANPGARAVLVATPRSIPEDVASQVRSNSIASVILNHVPTRRIEATRAAYEAFGVTALAIVPEDRLLASPTIGQFADALGADGENIGENRDRPLDRPIIASIAADPGQAYFARTEAQAVIVRSDKPDLQLAALNADAGCLIVTGGLPILSYVLDRVRENEIPLLRTQKDTRETVAVLEDLFGGAPFTGEPKTRRIAALLGAIDLDALLQRTANPA